MTHDPQFDHQPDARDESLRARIARGTEDLSEEARRRVIDARQRAVSAAREARRQASKAQDHSVDLFERQPLIAGALAFAIGAAIGAALPRTRLEDNAFGTRRDELVAEAERIFAEEKERARVKIKDAGREAETALRDAAAAAQAKVAEHLPHREDVVDAPAEEMSQVADKAASRTH